MFQQSIYEKKFDHKEAHSSTILIAQKNEEGKKIEKYIQVQL